MLGANITPQRATFERSWEAYTLLAPPDSLFLPRANIKQAGLVRHS